MLTRTCRLPQFGKVLVGSLGLMAAGQWSFAQSSTPIPPAPEAEQSPYASLPDSDVPRIAQSPQTLPPHPSAEMPSPEGAFPGMEFPQSTASPTTPGSPTGMGSPGGMGAPGGAPSFAGDFASAFTPGTGGAGGGASAPVAANSLYIDSAIIRTRLRVRYDANYDLNTPDKAEFFYAKCGCFGNPANFINGQNVLSQAANGGPFTFHTNNAMQLGYDPKARGPQHAPIVPGVPRRFSTAFPGDNRIDYQEQTTYFEYAPVNNFSAFIEVPVRFLNPSMVSNFYGFSDINAGFKYAFVAEPDRYYTFQLRGYMPTGASDKGLGTGHSTLEPALLVFQRLSDRLYFNGEFRDWIPINGSNFAGNVLRYGAGLTYNIVLTDTFRVAPVNEIVGWTILGGKELVPTSGVPVNVGGDTIVNEKIGIQFGLGDYSRAGGGSNLNDRHSLGISYGRAITGDHWYRDVLRVEYNFWF